MTPVQIPVLTLELNGLLLAVLLLSHYVPDQIQCLFGNVTCDYCL